MSDSSDSTPQPFRLCDPCKRIWPESTAMTRHFPFDNPIKLVRIQQDNEGLWQIWTARDDKPGSRNNFVIAQGIQGELDAAFIRDAINAAIVKVNTEWHEVKS